MLGFFSAGSSYCISALVAVADHDVMDASVSGNSPSADWGALRKAVLGVMVTTPLPCGACGGIIIVPVWVVDAAVGGVAAGSCCVICVLEPATGVAVEAIPCSKTGLARKEKHRARLNDTI